MLWLHVFHIFQFNRICFDSSVIHSSQCLNMYVHSLCVLQVNEIRHRRQQTGKLKNKWALLAIFSKSNNAKLYPRSRLFISILMESGFVLHNLIEPNRIIDSLRRNKIKLDYENDEMKFNRNFHASLLNAKCKRIFYDFEEY